MTVFEDDFEDGTINAWDSTSTSAGCSVSASTTQKAHGSYSMECLIDNNGERAYAIEDFSSELEVYVRLYMRLGSVSGGCYVRFLQIRDSSNNAVCSLFIQYAGGNYTLRLYRDNWTTVGSYVMSGFSTSTFYCYELRFKKHASDGAYQCWIDGTLRITSTGLNTISQDTPERIQVGIRESGNSTITMYVDDVVVADAYIGPIAGVSIPVIVNHLKNQGIM